MSTETGGWRIGVDVGGTFTDLVACDPRGAIHAVKVPSVPDNPAVGVLDAVERMAGAAGMDLGALLGKCSVFVHGSTVATNAVLEGKGAKVGLVVTDGFRDSLEIRRGIRDNPWDHRTPYPSVMVPRYLRRPVKERIDRRGRAVTPLDHADVEAAADFFSREGVESIAVCLFNSFAEGAHERAVADLLRAKGLDRWITLSSEVAPVAGEYERGSTAVVNAYVAPRAIPYLAVLARRLRELGLRSPLLLVQSNGGVLGIDQIRDRPAVLVLSGPAAGVGALDLYRPAIGADDLVLMEIGGTSCDVTLMAGGEVALTDSLEIGGYHLSIPSVEIHTVGAGGGTVSGVDPGGLLFAGPRGAGARPGPACYGLGGEEPTVTDAQLVLGRLAPGLQAGGTVKLDLERARDAVRRKVAEPLGLDLDSAAAGIVRLVEQHLLHAVERVSLQRGYDPRRFVLVAAGGAGPIHGVSVGRLLGCRRVYVPRLAGAFCALGMLHADVRHDVGKAIRTPLAEDAVAALDDSFRELERTVTRRLAETGFSGERTRLDRILDLRYAGQQTSIPVPCVGGVDAIRSAFEARHARQYGHIQPDGGIEATAMRVFGVGKMDPLNLARVLAAESLPQPRIVRQVYLEEIRGRADTPIFDARNLGGGHRIAGPAIVEAETTTLFIGPGDVLSVDGAGNFSVELGEAKRVG